MPTDKKRINLTISDQLYERILAYKERHGIINDATACLQLITQQLNSFEQSEKFMQLVNSLSREKVLEMGQEGLSALKDEIAPQFPGGDKKSS